MNNKKFILLILLSVVFLTTNFFINSYFTFVIPLDKIALVLSGLFFCLALLSWNNSFHFLLKLMAVFLLLLCIIIAAAYFLGNFFTGEGISYAVLNHLSLDSLEAGAYELTMYHYALFALLGSYIVAFFLLKGNKLFSNKGNAILCALFSVLCVVVHPGTKDITQLAILLSEKQPDETLLEFYADGRISDATIEEVKKEKKDMPNVLIIFLEGIEQRYLDDQLFPELASNLSHITENSHQFSDALPVWGASHTIAGMVSSFCSIPYAKLGGGKYQHGEGSVYMPNAQCLGDITKKLGYTNIYYQGARLSFSRKGSFYKQHGFEEVKGLSYMREQVSNEKKHIGTWGMNDDMVLDVALKKLRKLKDNADSPFLMTLLTLDSHDLYSDNYMSKECIKNNVNEYKLKDHEIQNAIKCTDYLINSFVNTVSNEWGDDLEIYIVSDHLSPSHSTGEKLLQLDTDQRKLIFSHVNGNKKINSRPITNFEIAPTILSNITNEKIERLGLGVSAFSDKLNLREQSGIDKLNNRLAIQ